MRNRFIVSLGVRLVLLLVASGDALSAEEKQLSDNVNQKNFETPTPEQVSNLEAMFSAWMNAEPNDSEEALARSVALGFDVHRDDSGYTFLADSEARGWGYYHFGPSSAGALVLQAPHQFFDRHTGAIARGIFERVPVRVLALNSSHRYTDRKEGSAPSDLSHIPFSPFNALTRAVALSLPDAHVVQIHGYSAEKRKTDAAKTSDIIISSGVSASQPGMLALADCIEASTPWTVLRFPGQTSELGGTRNLQGRLLHALGKPIFTHLELSRVVRDSLVNDPEALNQFTQCFVESGTR